MCKNLDECSTFDVLKKLPVPKISFILKSKDCSKRIAGYSVPIISGLYYNYAAKKVDEKIINTLQALSDEQSVISKYKSLLKGDVVNKSENRLVLHHLTRDLSILPLVYSSRDVHAFYRHELEKVKVFVENIHNKKILSTTGKPFTDVVQIGIGGSDLGPRSLYIALKEYAHATKNIKIRGHFISNIDPQDAVSVFDKIEPTSSLFILVSKSGTTEETLSNEKLLLKFLEAKGIKDVKKNIVVVTSSTSPLAKDDSYLQSFFIDDYIGGRYSSTSCCGALILSLCFGNDLFLSLLEGANEADKNALNQNIRENASLMDALIGIYESSVLGYKATAVLPYSQALSRFPAHLQQLDMESSGKMVNIWSQYIEYATGPLLFGEAGTNGQHSFYQFLHQSKQIIPLQFIAFRESSLLLGNHDIISENNSGSCCEDFEKCIKENHKKLLTNLVAQIYAFAVGKQDEDKNKCFEGEKPSSLIYGNVLDAKVLGALLAHFENKVMFQGFLWNINSFDQEGVQLGKTLARKINEGDIDEALKAYSDLML